MVPAFFKTEIQKMCGIFNSLQFWVLIKNQLQDLTKTSFKFKDNFFESATFGCD